MCWDDDSLVTFGRREAANADRDDLRVFFPTMEEFESLEGENRTAFWTSA